MSIRVALVDDHQLLTEAMHLLLSRQRDIEVVGTVNHSGLAIELIEAVKPDVLVLDLNMPGHDGRDVLRQLRKLDSLVATLVVTGSDDLESVQDALALGARGFITKTRSGDQLVEAVRAVSEGQTYIGAVIEETPVDAEMIAKRESLSDREFTALHLIAFGFTNKAIGERMGLSIKTIEGYRAKISSKLDASSRADLVRHALRMGLLKRHPDDEG